MKVELIFPPRPEHVITSDKLDDYDNGRYIAQQKSNGSYGILYLHPTQIPNKFSATGYSEGMEWEMYNRHKEPITNINRKIDFPALFRQSVGDMVLAGEYLNKNKKNSQGKPFNHKYILFDILKFDGKWLTGTTLEYRLSLLEMLYPAEDTIITDDGLHVCDEPWLSFTNVKDVYRCEPIRGNFETVYQHIISTDYIEGLVIKNKQGKLQPLHSAISNAAWQIKCRKPAKNYFY